MKKEKLTLQQKLAKRKFRIPSKLGFFIYKTIMLNIIAKKYHIHYEFVDDPRKSKEPCIIIFNHLSRLDHVYVLGAMYPRRFNMLAGYNEFFRSHLALVFRLNNCIPKKNYTPDTQSVKGISSILKQGGCVAFAPEGLASNYGCNKPVVPGTGKMLKHFKVPVYFCHLQGTYLQNTKVCLDERYGETYCTVSKLFTPEQLQEMSVEEIDNSLNENFRSDEYAWQKQKHIKWETHGRICEKLEDFCYKCPKCGSELTMKGVGDRIECSACGNGATMNDYYEFIPYENAVIPESPLVWVENERQDLIREIRQNPEYSFVEHVQIGNIPTDHLLKDLKTSEIVGEGDLIINHKGVHYVGTRNGENYEFHLDYNHIYTTITTVDSSYFNFYVNGEYFDFFPQRQTVGKMILLIEEMHRYHVNFYKNFTWNDYMYEGMELGIDNKK